jgi:hypothetical protein
VSIVNRTIAAAALAACALAAFGFATPAPDQPQNVFLPGRTFGLGEQQVYLVERNESIVVRFRNANGDVVSKTVKRRDHHSFALTVVGFDADGSAVLAVSAEGQPALAAPGGDVNAASSQDATQPEAVQASPAVTADGRVNEMSRLAPLLTSSLVIASGPDQPLADGAKWITSGELPIPAGSQRVRLGNAASTWSEDAGVLEVVSTGTFEAAGSAPVPAFGQAALRGNGSVSGTSYVDMRNRLLLGSVFTLKSNGNATNGRGGSATFSLSASCTFKLMRFVAGLLPPPTPAGGLAPRADNIRTGPPPDNLTRQGAPDQMARPAATDNIFRASPLPQDTPEPLPDVSLPPVPIPVSSGLPLASPPPPPPTPVPTHTPH